MAKPKKDFSTDASDIFNLSGLKEETNIEVMEEAPEKKEQESPKEAPAPSTSQRRHKESDGTKMTTKTFRITEAQYRALKIKSAMSDNPDEKDLSSIVRLAIDNYLK